jgi:hypothetical protein
VRNTLVRPIVLSSAALAALLAACGDDPVGPGAFFEFVEADAVVRSAAALPSLGEIIDRAPASDPSDRATLVLARQLWALGAASDSGGARREEAISYSAPALTGLLPEEEWGPLLLRTDAWIETAQTMLHHLSLPAIEQRIATARQHVVLADAATPGAARVYHLLMALSDLVETTPAYVARGLVADAAVAVRRAEGAGVVDAAALGRARRLAQWAARAHEEGDHVRAIQRAYYAIQLVEGL